MFIYLRLIKESFYFALNALRSNKLRTFLSLLGVTIGIFSIIGVLAAVDSLDRSIKSDLEGLDKNTMYLTKYSFGPTDVPRWKRDNYPQVEYPDYEFVNKSINGVQASAYVIFGSQQTIKYEDKTVENIDTTPVSSGIYEIDNLKLDRGRFYTEMESHYGSPVMVVGFTLAENLFGSANPIGKEVRVYGRKVTVIGVLKKFGVTIFDSPDEKAYLPANFVRKFMSTGPNGVPGAVIIKPKADVDIAEFEQNLKQRYRLYRGLKQGDEDNFFVNKLSGFTEAIDGIIGTLTLIGGIIGGFSLLVGCFGIANIMFVTVKERTNQIGIQKALGAKNRFILLQFLFEAMVLSMLGGLIGLVLVWVMSLVAKAASGGFEFILSSSSIFWGIFWTLLVGLLAGLIPAFKASRMDPVEAIRTGI